MSRNEQGFAFIVGHKKSGSTWLLNLLSLHPDIRGLMETHLFGSRWNEPDPVRRTDQLFTRTPWGHGGFKKLPEHLLTRMAGPVLRRFKPALSLQPEEKAADLFSLPLRAQLELRRDLRRITPPADYARYFLDFMRDALRPGRYLLEKSPRHIHQIDRIQAVAPRAKLIAIYRDGRDVVVSDWFFTQEYQGKPFSFTEAVCVWREDMEAQLRCAECHPLCAVSYEALLADGAQPVRSVLEFLGLRSDDALVKDLLERSSFRFYTSREPGQENRRRFYRKGVVGDWKSHFTPEHKRIFKDMAGDLLVKLDYEKDFAW